MLSVRPGTQWPTAWGLGTSVLRCTETYEILSNPTFRSFWLAELHQARLNRAQKSIWIQNNYTIDLGLIWFCLSCSGKKCQRVAQHQGHQSINLNNITIQTFSCHILTSGLTRPDIWMMRILHANQGKQTPRAAVMFLEGAMSSL